MYLSFELGDYPRVNTVAQTYLSTRASWLLGRSLDTSITASRLEYMTGALSVDKYHAARDAWLARQSTHVGLDEANLRWLLSYAQAVVTDVDAVEALAVLPQYGPLVDPLTRDADCDHAIGHTYLVANRVSESIPYLERAAHSCDTINMAFSTTWANLALGHAFERIEAPIRACDSYRTVLRRWIGVARSRSARDASARFRALRCIP